MNETGKAVFLSCAAQDADVARRLAAALRAAGVEVWFDPEEPRGGDEWERKIKRQIRECALFVAIISAQTQARHEDYFRLEWHLAEQRSRLIAKGRPFIVPVCADGTTENEAFVPEAFLAVPWSRPVRPAQGPELASDGQLAPFVAHVQRLLAQPLPASRQSGSGAGNRRPFTPESPSIPDYELIRQIGRGSYGDVWLARGVTGIYRAVKLVWRERFADPAPFEREFKGLAEFAAISLGESIQLALLHVGRNDDLGFFYYVMELADDVERGRSIDPERYVPLTFTELHKRRGRIPVADCLGYAVELARVLAGLHARGLVHRDVKPSNVILVNGVPKLADIGLVAPAASARTFVGTEGFVPPEGPGSPAADVYALGKVLYELSTGLDRQEFPQLPSGLSQLGDHDALLDLNEVVLRACDPSPARRYHDGAALLADLETLRAGRPVVGVARWKIAAAAAAVVLLAGVAFFVSPKKTTGSALVAQALPAAETTHVPPVLAPARSQPPTLASRPTPAAPGPFQAPEVAAEKSLVVLPLKNLSLALNDRSFHEDLHEEIIGALARLPDTRVVARGSTLRRKNVSLPPARIAQDFGVAHFLRGTVLRQRDAVQLALELRRARDDAVVWTKRYDAELREFAALMTELAGDIAHALHARAPGPTLAAAHAGYFTRNPAALDLFFKARRAALNQSEVAKNEACILIAEEAMTLDPNFGAAAVLLAASHIAAFRNERDQPTKDRYVVGGKHWAETASRLVPDGGGDRELGYYHVMVEPDYPRSIAYAASAARAWPHDARHHDLLAVAFHRAGRHADAVAACDQAIALDPLDQGMRHLHFVYLYRLRRVDAWRRAVAGYRATLGLEPPAEAFAFERYALTGELPADHRAMSYTSRMDWLWRARKFDEFAALAEVELPKPKSGMVELFTLQVRWAEALQRAGRADEARPHADEALRLALDTATRPTIVPHLNDLRLGRIHALLGAAEPAIAAMHRAVAAIPANTKQVDHWDVQIKFAEVYATLGRAPECVALLAELLRVSSGLTVPILQIDPVWDPVRNDAGFQALLADPKNSAPL